MKFSQRKYLHSFQIVPVGVGKVCIQRGLVYSATTEDTNAVFEVEGATNDLFFEASEIKDVNSDQEIFVILKHAKKDDTFLFCNIEECFISTEDFDSNQYTRVNVGSVKWVGIVPSVSQKLAGDIYCRIPGTRDDDDI